MLTRRARYTYGIVGLFEGWDVSLRGLGSICGDIELLEVRVEGNMLDRMLSLVLCIVRLLVGAKSNASVRPSFAMDTISVSITHLQRHTIVTHGFRSMPTEF